MDRTRLMASRCFALVVLILALVAPSATASPAGSDFTIAPNPPNPGQVVTFTFVPGPDIVGDPTVQWDVRGNADFDEAGSVATQAYSAPGPVTVVMRVTDDEGSQDFPKTFTVNAPPAAAFSVDPGSPLAGELVTFTGGSDPDGDALTRAVGVRGRHNRHRRGPEPRLHECG